MADNAIIDDALPMPVNICMVPVDTVPFRNYLISEADGNRYGIKGFKNVYHTARAEGIGYRIAFQSNGRRCWQVIVRKRERRKPTRLAEAGWDEWGDWYNINTVGMQNPEGFDDDIYWICTPSTFSNHGNQYIASGYTLNVTGTDDVYDAVEYEIRARVYREDVKIAGNYASANIVFYRDPVVKAKSLMLDGNVVRVYCDLGNMAGCTSSHWWINQQRFIASADNRRYYTAEGPNAISSYDDDGIMQNDPYVTIPRELFSQLADDAYENEDERKWVLTCFDVVDSYGMPCANNISSDPITLYSKEGAIASPSVRTDGSRIVFVDDASYDDVDVYVTYETHDGTASTDRVQATLGEDGVWVANVGLLPSGKDVDVKVIASRDLEWGSYTTTFHIPYRNGVVLLSPDGTEFDLVFAMHDGGVDVKENYSPETEGDKVAGRKAPIYFDGIGGTRTWSITGAAINSFVEDAFDMKGYRKLETGGTWQFMDDNGEIWKVHVKSLSLHDKELRGDIHTYDIELVEVS